jgi:hypothetical protein
MNGLIEPRPPTAPNFQFSGHETFPCRYAWLPKAVEGLQSNPAFLAAEDDAMVQLGVGKNMVRAIRFWVKATGMARPAGVGRMEVTDVGRRVFGGKGHDRYLEDIQTLWLIHWMIGANDQEPLFAWHFLLNCWHRPDFTRTEALRAFEAEAGRLGRRLSAVTLEHHFSTFLHTYLPTRGAKVAVLEDNLDCPLVELRFILQVGDRTLETSGRRESIYAFRADDKPEIAPALFVYCLNDFWDRRHGNEQTLTFRQVAVGEGSPGQVFRLPEASIQERLEAIETASNGVFAYQESSAMRQLLRPRRVSPTELLERVYRERA